MSKLLWSGITGVHTEPNCPPAQSGPPACHPAPRCQGSPHTPRRQGSANGPGAPGQHSAVQAQVQYSTVQVLKVKNTAGPCTAQCRCRRSTLQVPWHPRSVHAWARRGTSPSHQTEVHNTVSPTVLYTVYCTVIFKSRNCTGMYCKELFTWGSLMSFSERRIQKVGRPMRRQHLDMNLAIIIYSVQWTLYSETCTVYRVECTVYSRLLHPQHLDGM